MKADRGSYFRNYIHRMQTNMKKEKERNKKKKRKRKKKRTTQKVHRKKEDKDYLKEELIIIECFCIQISSQKHNEIF